MNWLIFFLVLPHLKPPSLEYLWPMWDTLFDLGRLASALLILYIHLLKKKIPSKPVWVLLVLRGWLLTTTYLNGGDLRKNLLNTVSILAVVLLIDLYSNRMTVLISSLLVALELMVHLNLLSVLIYYPAGMYRGGASNYNCYFLGYHNAFMSYVLLAICVALLYRKQTGKTLRSTLLIASSVLAIVICWSATSVCALLCFGAILLLSKTKWKDKITFSNIFLGTMAANLAISVFRIMDKAMWAVWFIENFLKKKVTLTGRTFIWDKCYEMFFASPLLGHGDGVQIQTVAVNAGHAHNQWLHYLVTGGIPLLLIFLFLIFMVGGRLNLLGKNEYSRLFCAVFATLFVVYITEAGDGRLINMLYILAYHIDKFEVAAPGKKLEKRVLYHKDEPKIFTIQ